MTEILSDTFSHQARRSGMLTAVTAFPSHTLQTNVDLHHFSFNKNLLFTFRNETIPVHKLHRNMWLVGVFKWQRKKRRRWWPCSSRSLRKNGHAIGSVSISQTLEMLDVSKCDVTHNWFVLSQPALLITGIMRWLNKLSNALPAALPQQGTILRVTFSRALASHVVAPHMSDDWSNYFLRSVCTESSISEKWVFECVCPP